MTNLSKIGTKVHLNPMIPIFISSLIMKALNENEVIPYFDLKMPNLPFN